MGAYIAKRLALMIPTLFGILLISFAVIQFVPGGPVEQLMMQLKGGTQGAAAEAGGQFSGGLYRGEQGLGEEQIEQFREFYGFDQPAYIRFGDMLGNYLTFDLGESYFYQRSVGELIVEKLPVSISLGVWTFLLTYLVSIPLGVAKAVRDGSKFDSITSTVILVGYAIPGFVLGLVLLVLFGGGSFVQWFPLRGLTSDNFEQLSLMGKILDYLWHLVLPITAMVVGNFAVMTMLTKNSFLEEIRKQYVLTARAKGLAERTVLYRHVFRNALIPIVTGFPAAFIGAFFWQPADRDHFLARR